MDNFRSAPVDDLQIKLKWLIVLRVVFTILLLGSTIILQMGESQSPFSQPLLSLYLLTSAIFIISVAYSILLPVIRQVVAFAYLQIGLDTVFVTLVIYVTGGFSSIFAILYLLVIIYASMLLFRSGSLVMAALCSIQYGFMIDLEYYGLLSPYGMEGSQLAMEYPWSFVLYKVIMIMVGCFAVAFLSSLLAEQARKTRRELSAMEAHVKRVEKMAAIGEMAAGLAHEIKNPLASLRGSVQLIMEDGDYDSDQDRLMQIVVREADRLSALVSNFLLFARPPAGKVERIELDKALNETIELFEKDETCCNRITIHRDLRPGVWVEMDSQHLRQIFWNLLINAAEAIGDNGTIAIRLEAGRNRRASVHITDDGCGMAPEIVQSIFDPFFTTKASGTGLGLSIVHRIIESYDSLLEVESEIGKGTTVTLQLRQGAPS